MFFSIEIANYRASTETCNYRRPAKSPRNTAEKDEKRRVREGERDRGQCGYGCTVLRGWEAAGAALRAQTDTSPSSLQGWTFQLKAVTSRQSLGFCRCFSTLARSDSPRTAPNPHTKALLR